MAIRYKAVTVEGDGRRYSLLCDLLGKQCTLEYPEGAVVRALEGSMGIATFDTLKAAKKAALTYSDSIVIRVAGIGRGVRPKVVLQLADLWFNLDAVDWHRYRHIKSAREMYCHLTKAETVARVTTFWPTPVGTMCYRAVYVID